MTGTKLGQHLKGVLPLLDILVQRGKTALDLGRL